MSYLVSRNWMIGLSVSALVLLGIGTGAGYWLARRAHPGVTAMQSPTSASPAEATGKQDRKVLYWYDPMQPNQHFNKPGKSPFMDMQLVPKYADAGADTGAIEISPNIVQNLGVRIAPVERGPFSQPISAVANLVLNQRQVAIVQSRTNGFVSRVYNRAPDDVLKRGAPLADLLVPEWAGAQAEFLALVRNGDRELVEAARQRLVLLGMPADLIGRVESSRQQQTTITVVAPIRGAIESLEVRQGMTVSGGMTLAKINGLDPIWLEAQIPEASTAAVAVGQAVEAEMTAYPGKAFTGKVTEILPEANVETRAMRIRAELPNPALQLKPGMFARIRLDTDTSEQQLLVPSEAVIHTGTRDLVIVALDNHRFQPTEVQTGPEAAGRTVILSGLQEGQKVVASGQFLIDSEASLRGVLARLNSAPGSQP